MEIKRMNCDFGNSTSNFMIDGYYLEFPTIVAEISKREADRIFVSPIEEKKDLKGRLMISIGENEKQKFYLVGELAENYVTQDINNMTDKIHSIVPYVSFLGALAYYNTIKGDNDNTIEIDNIMMMLPIWLLKKAAKFKDAQVEMAARFSGQHKVKILTLGMEKEIKINIKNSDCKIEGEVARFALKYRMVQEKEKDIKIEPRPEIEKFKDFETVLCDLGGGSTDCVRLGKNLSAPKERNSFKVIDIEPFLGYLETFRKEKLLQYFSNVKKLENFIVKNYKKQKYVLEDPNTGKSSDFTKIITEMLQDYSDLLINKIFNTFKETDNVIKFIYFGGEASILKPYIRQTLLGIVTEKISEDNHLFLDELLENNDSEIFRPNSRTINLAALELISLSKSKQSKNITSKK